MINNILRVFPRKTSATPNDIMVRIGEPTMFDSDYERIDISVTFTWDKQEAERLFNLWKHHTSNINIGGPAYNARGYEFTPGLYLKKDYVITSRGCPNRCSFCYAWKREGETRQLEIKEGWNVLDNNLLACSRNHKALGLEYNKGGTVYRLGILWIPKSQITFTEVIDLTGGNKKVSLQYSWVCTVPEWMLSRFN
jgi:hypothetical protein